MRVLFLDCLGGISGDMTVGALCHLGVQPSTLEWELSKLDLGDYHLHFEPQRRRDLEGVKFTVHPGAVHTHDQDAPADEHGQVHEHAHEHEHGPEGEHGHAPDKHEHERGEEEHGHDPAHTYPALCELLEGSDLSDFVKRHAVSLLGRIATAEGRVRGVPPENIAWRADAALDTLADLVCACVGIETLNVERVIVSPLADGRGWTDAGAHGRFPIPSPAALEILRAAQAPLAQRNEPHELVTPTGAALAVEFALATGGGFGLLPAGLHVERIGYGLGASDLSDRANVLRAVLGTLPPTA